MVKEIFIVIKTLRDQGMTLLLVEQNVQQSLEIAEKGADGGAQVAALNNLSLAYADLPDLERAIGHVQQALELCSQQGDLHREAALHNNLADLERLAAEGETLEAQTSVAQAEQAYRACLEGLPTDSYIVTTSAAAQQKSEALLNQVEPSFDPSRVAEENASAR